MWKEASMPSTGTYPDPSYVEVLGVIVVNPIHRPMIIAFRPLEKSRRQSDLILSSAILLYLSSFLCLFNVFIIPISCDHKTMTVGQPNIILRISHPEMLAHKVAIHNDCLCKFPSNRYLVLYPHE